MDVEYVYFTDDERERPPVKVYEIGKGGGVICRNLRTWLL